MADTIRTILEELYALEPELKEREAELAPLILKLVELKPDIKPSASFAQELKLKLINHEQELMTNNIVSNDKITLLMKIFSFLRTPYLVVGAGLVAIALILVASLPGLWRRTATTQPFAASVTRLPEGAFGSLVATAGGTATPVGLGAGQAERGLGSAEFGAGVDKSAALQAVPSAVAPSVGFNESVDSSVATSAPAGLGGSGVGIARPDYYRLYNYRYAGEPVTDLPGQVDVLRRVKNVGLPVNAGFLGSFDVGSLKLNSFSETSLSQVTLTEDREFGYVISIDFMEGTVNVFENWRRWPQPGNDCRDEVCYRNLQLKPEDMPDDASLIALANAWLNKHGINPASYGAPYVQDEWRVYYAQAEDKPIAYVPDVVTVIYPLQVNDAAVYENGGSQAGLGVNVNVRYSRVSGMWNLTSQQYQSSAYEAETDFDTLFKYVNAGNQGYAMPLMYPRPPIDGGQKRVEIDLGTPTRGYLRYWNYLNNENQELLLPALVFPVQNQPADSNYYAPKQVVVPLVKEFLQTYYPGDGPIKIMPATPMPGASGSGSSSDGSVGVTESAVVEPAPTPLSPQY